MVVVCPLPAFGELVGEFGTEAQLVDFMGHGVAFVLGLVVCEVILEIVCVNVPAGEAAAWGDVEVSDDFVDADHSFEAAAFSALGGDALAVSFSFALFDVFAFTEGPGFLYVCFADFVASAATAGFNCAGWGWGSSAFSAVIGVKVFCDFFVGVAGSKTIGLVYWKSCMGM